MTILKQISTHKAVYENGEISVYLNELHIPSGMFNGVWYAESSYPSEKLYTLPLNRKDDLEAIFDRYEEDNRVNVAELNEEVT
jgi:hypothetical protein